MESAIRNDEEAGQSLLKIDIYLSQTQRKITLNAD